LNTSGLVGIGGRSWRKCENSSFGQLDDGLMDKLQTLFDEYAHDLVQKIRSRSISMNSGTLHFNEFSVQHSAIEAELPEMRESANRTQPELSELAIEIRTVSSASAIAREMLFLRADEADERLSWSERSSLALSAEVKGLRRRSNDAHEKIVAQTDDISKIKKDLKQFKDKVNQQLPAPASSPPAPTGIPLPPTSPPPAPLDSLIGSEYPSLFEEFRATHFNLLWRGSRDGFTAREFHRRCDGRANTLTLILGTEENVFDDFTSIE
jgi:hypothetical protein